MNARTAAMLVVFLGAAPALAQQAAPRFAAPSRLKIGEEFLGGQRMYPSPVFHDVNGDGLADVVIGDLPGRITYALRQRTEGAFALGAEGKLEDRDQEQLNFANW